jgi:hypothetical protein
MSVAPNSRAISCRTGLRAERDYLCSAEPLRGEDGAQSDCPVADHRDGAVNGDVSADGCVVAGAHDVGEREQRLEHVVGVVAVGDFDQGRVSERGPDCLALAAVDAVVAERPAVQAVVRPAGQAVGADAVAEGERRDDQVALAEGGHFGAGFLDDTDELVTDGAEGVRAVAAVVPQVRAADAAEHDPDDRVSGLLDAGVWPFADGEVERAAVDRCLHGYLRCWRASRYR